MALLSPSQSVWRGILFFLSLGGLYLSYIFFLSFLDIASLQESPDFEGHSPRNLFTREYPANVKFQAELQQLRGRGTLTTANEAIVNLSVSRVSDQLGMSPALLWCLLFQESRLDHLEGIFESAAAQGLGQFSHFSFYEVNHQLERYDSSNLKMFQNTFGQDIRPIGPHRNALHHPSSYYFIPTAVASSAAYYNNRFLQLRRIVTRNGLRYHPQILWLFAAMAYNKGTRSVLSLWQNIRNTEGDVGIERTLTRLQSFREVSLDRERITKALYQIWPLPVAQSYATELMIHVDNILQCSLDRPRALSGVGVF